MIDLHCHLLPGIDDGPKAMVQSLGMARHAVANGIRQCVVTPHIVPGCYENDIHTIQPVYQAFRDQLENDGIPLQVRMAAEVRISAELPALIAQTKIPFIGSWEGKQVLLLEFPHDHIPLGSDKLVTWLLARDVQPMIAHPERNKAIMRQPDKVLRFVDLGCLLQITAGSVTGGFGQDVQRIALSLIQQGVATALASDAHNLEKRKPDMTPAVEFLMPLIGEERVNQLIMSNPARMLS